MKALAARHPRNEHLSISTLCERITVDSCDVPFEGFGNLKSLELKIGRGRHCEYHYGIPSSIVAILDRLRLRSLEISGYTSFVPGPETTPNLMQFLVHLRINNTMTAEDAEKKSCSTVTA